MFVGILGLMTVACSQRNNGDDVNSEITTESSEGIVVPVNKETFISSDEVTAPTMGMASLPSVENEDSTEEIEN